MKYDRPTQRTPFHAKVGCWTVNLRQAEDRSDGPVIRRGIIVFNGPGCPNLRATVKGRLTRDLLSGFRSIAEERPPATVKAYKVKVPWEWGGRRNRNESCRYLELWQIDRDGDPLGSPLKLCFSQPVPDSLQETLRDHFKDTNPYLRAA